MTPDDDAALDVLAALTGLAIPAEARAGVLRQLRLNRAMAAPLLAFDLPEGTPPAPVFRP
jgi:hypothetical protein